MTDRFVHGSRRGVTLIELMVTLSMLGILVALALPRLDYVKFQADGAQRIVRGTLQRAQRTAVQRQYDVVVSFDTLNNRMRVAEDSNSDHVIDSNDRQTWRPLPERASFAVPPSEILGQTAGKIVELNARTVDGYPSIVFRRNGAASTDAVVYTTVRAWKLTDLRAVRVDQPTARTSIYRYTGSAWTLSSNP